MFQKILVSQRKVRVATVFFGSVLVATSLAGCGGGPSPLPMTSSVTANAMKLSGSPVIQSAATAADTKVSFEIAIPQATSVATRNKLYISPGTKSASIEIDPIGTTSRQVTVTNCAAACSGSAMAPVGTVTFHVVLYDAANAKGNILSEGSSTTNIVHGQANNVSIVFGGVISKVIITPTPSTVTIGTSSTIQLNVTAFDASGNQIIGAQAFDSPIMLASSAAGGAFTLSNNSLSNPQSGVTVHYTGATTGGTTIAASMQSGAAITSSSATITAVTPATPTPAPAPITSGAVRAHMLTYAIIAGDYHNVYGVTPTSTTQADYRILAKYIDYLETDNRATNVAHAAGMKVGFYTDPVRPHYNELSWSSDAYAHDCNGNIVVPDYSPTLEYLGNMGSPALTQAWNAEIASHLQDQYGSYTQDFVRADDSGNQAEGFEVFFQNAFGGSQEPTGQPYCNYSDSSFLTGIRALYQQASLPVIFNGDTSTQYDSYMQSEPNILGSQCESCFVDTSTATWVKEVNAEIGAVALHKIFNSFSHGPYTTQQQMYLYGSMLLGFDPNYVSLYTDAMNARSGIDISPLVSLVPMQPTITASNVGQYRSAEGNYVRQFGQCYVKQVAVGPCAVVVNSDSSPHAFPSSLSQYHHTATISGTGIITEFGDNGAISVNGAAPPNTVGSQQAIIIFQ